MPKLSLARYLPSVIHSFEVQVYVRTRQRLYTSVLLVAVTTYFVPGELSPHIRDFLTLLRFPGCNERDLQPPLPVLLSLLMMEIQVIRRFLECLFISIYGNSVMSVVIYIVGVAYYSAIGLSAISLTHEEIISTDHLYSDLRWYQVLAVLLFIYASWKQNRLGIILAKLRKDKNGKVEDVKHHIPNGNLFEYCSCPHFFMEILIYAAICTVFLWQHEVLNCVFVFVLVNQTLSGLMSHKWYREKFPSYPKNRRAVLPFIL
ncbi:hypothetical protein FSP39_004172 [Pinctada imbricata]|uniref:Polyprenal reductase n=1 Tax=Pinctada imbricata TaxID=66713 RepID=A0AA88Y6L2_PINIB|nr:hypothetical protein FSP39_004172 [Pinctada imbricata]